VVTTGQPKRWLATVCFPYDQGAVALVKTVPRRKCHPAEKAWTVPADLASLAAGEFVAAGYRALVDGRPYRAPHRLTDGRRGDGADPVTASWPPCPSG
jgi:hypothetical protein